MKTNLITINGENIIELIPDDIEIKGAQDAVDLMAKCFVSGARKLIIHEKSIDPSFFDLKTRVAGEILQKFVNYNFKVAIIGDYSKYQSGVLKDFIYESNKQGEINFVSSPEEARQRLIEK
jgi:hypothetical protein